MANVLEHWYPPSKKCFQPCQQPYSFTIDLISGFPYYFSSENPIGGIACIILVVRAPIEGSAYFRFYPTAIRRKNLGQSDWLTINKMVLNRLKG